MINLHNAEILLSAAKPEQFPQILPEVCFAGRSNVGKSTLINKLLNRKNFARVSATPGKTATINFYMIDKKIYLTDLPGYGYAKVSDNKKELWNHLMESYFDAGRDMRKVILLVDIRHDPSQDDIIMADYLMHTGYDFMVVATKKDKISKTQAEKNILNIRKKLRLFENCLVMPFSGLNGDGKEDILKIILNCVE